MPDLGDEVAASVDGEFKQMRNALVRAACSKFCQTITKKIKEFKESKAAAAAAAGGDAAERASEGAQSVELNLKCSETGADPIQAFDKLKEIASGEGFPDIDPANMQLIGADNPATASAVVAFPKGALGQVTSLAQSFEQTMGLMAADAPQAVQAPTQCHVMGFENIPAELRPTFLAEFAQACTDQGLDLSAISTSTRESGLLAGNITVTCNSVEEFSRAEAAVSSIAQRWVKAAGGISCAEGVVPAAELPLSADELSEQAEALAAQLIDSGFPSPVVTLSRNGADGGRANPDSFSMGVSYDRAAGARMGFDDEKLSAAIGKWRTGEKAKIANNGAPAAGSFAEKKMRAIAGADIVTRDPAKMSPKGRNLVAENAERAAAAKAKRLASMAKAAI